MRTLYGKAKVSKRDRDMLNKDIYNMILEDANNYHMRVIDPPKENIDDLPLSNELQQDVMNEPQGGGMDMEEEMLLNKLSNQNKKVYKKKINIKPQQVKVKKEKVNKQTGLGLLKWILE